MPLIAFTKMSAPDQISTITTSMDRDSPNRKRIFETKYDSPSSRSKLYVRPCEEHGGGSSTVPVTIMAYVERDWVSLGVARCCPLCWKIVVPPPTKFPPPSVDLLLRKTRDKKPKKDKVDNRAGHREGKTRMVTKLKLLQTIKEAYPAKVSNPDLVTMTGISRAYVIQLINELEKDGRIIVERGGTGRGVKTLSSWKKAP